jgi:copper chaperone CopZ
LKTEKALFRRVGMYCATCKPIIENWLKGEKGVKAISIDFTTDSIVVEFDPSLVTRQEIKDKLDKSGYKFVRVASRYD